MPAANAMLFTQGTVAPVNHTNSLDLARFIQHHRGPVQRSCSNLEVCQFVVATARQRSPAKWGSSEPGSQLVAPAVTPAGPLEAGRAQQQRVWQSLSPSVRSSLQSPGGGGRPSAAATSSDVCPSVRCYTGHWQAYYQVQPFQPSCRRRKGQGL